MLNGDMATIERVERDVIRREGEKPSAIEAVKTPTQGRANVPEREHVPERMPEREIILDMDMEW